MSRPPIRPQRRLTITVCPKEPGRVAIAVERGGSRRRLDARGVVRELEALVARRNLGEVVRVREGCAGGCQGRGPNVSLALYAVPPPGAPPDNVAIAWRTYVGSLAEVASLAALIDDNLA